MSRETILARVKRNVKAAPNRMEAVEARLKGDYAHRADWVAVDAEKLVTTFIEKAEYASASAETVKDDEELVEALARYMRAKNLPFNVRMGADERLSRLPLKKAMIEAKSGIAEDQDEIGLSHAFTGIAETGTLALLSGGDNPSTINFLPANHVVVVKASDIVKTYEDMWARLRAKHPKMLPRTVNLITGPSRSADIEQTLLLGAHGPKSLHILIVQDI